MFLTLSYQGVAMLWKATFRRFATGCCSEPPCPESAPGKDKGNGRAVRNVVESSIRFFAKRPKVMLFFYKGALR